MIVALPVASKADPAMREVTDADAKDPRNGNGD